MRMPASRGKARFNLFALAVVLILGVVLCVVLMRDRGREPSAQSSAPTGGVPDAKFFADSLPKQGGPQGYAGSASCKECHPKQFETWWRSYHRQMTQVMNTNTVKADFDGVTMDALAGRGSRCMSLQIITRWTSGRLRRSRPRGSRTARRRRRCGCRWR